MVTRDTKDAYDVYTAVESPNGKPWYFGGVHKRSKYVSFHWFAVYVDPGMLSGASDALKKRMQGKSCFNFAVIDKPLFRELAKLTDASFKSWKRLGRI